MSLKKVGEYVTTFFIVTIFLFFIPRMMPGDPFDYLSEDPASDVLVVLSQQQKQRLREYYGLDKPLIGQYLQFLSNIFTFKLGTSIYYKTSINKLIVTRLPWTALLVLTSTAISLIMGILLGANSAWKHSKLTDRLLLSFALSVNRVPSFLVAITLIMLFSGHRGFPFGGAMTPHITYANIIEKISDITWHLVLPATALTITQFTGYFLITRNSMVDNLGKGFIQTAFAKGLPDRAVKYRHALRPSLLPVVTFFFMRLSVLITGVVFVESVFSYPGLGSLISEAIIVRDYPLMESVFLFFSVLVLICNLGADLLYPIIDPRVET